MADDQTRLLDELVAAIGDRSARGIATAVGREISQGTVRPGARLPTVRALASELGTSPARVDEAWRMLVARGLIDTNGRRGTLVRDQRQGLGPARSWGLTAEVNQFKLDLSTGAADHDLLPDLHGAMSRSSRRLEVTGYHDDSVIRELEELFRARWRPEAEVEKMTVVNGALDAFDRLFGVTLRFGDRVIVEEPGYPPIFDLLEAHGAEPVPVTLDDSGIRPASLVDALRSRPAALVLQPRAQNPTGISTTQARARELAKSLLAAPDLLVFEDDHSADIVRSRSVTLAKHLPDRTVRVLSLSKSHGPDLRLAVVGGPAHALDPLIDRRRLGPGWASRMSQTLLVAMLRDPQATAQVKRARTVYAERRRRLVRELDRLGIPSTGTDGINLWISVRREREAVHALASQGISVAPGAPFFLRRDPPGFIRVTYGVVAEGYAELAVAIAGAARPASPSRGSAL